MHVEFYGLAFDAPRVTFYLWSPWRASALEHRMFDVVRALPGLTLEKEADELRVHIDDARTWKTALTSLCRVLKGWQEEADTGRERRAWRWLIEGDTDDNGYDHAGEMASLWGFLQLGLEKGNPEDGDKWEEINLDDFGLRIWAHSKK